MGMFPPDKHHVHHLTLMLVGPKEKGEYEAYKKDLQKIAKKYGVKISKGHHVMKPSAVRQAQPKPR